MTLNDETVVVLDLELTGLDPVADRIVEVGVVRGRRTGPVETWSSLVRPGVPMSAEASVLTGLDDAALEAAPLWHEVEQELRRWTEGAVLVGHRGALDAVFLATATGRECAPPTFDTWDMARRLLSLRSHALASVCRALGITPLGAHRALHDAEATWRVFWALVEVATPGVVPPVEALKQRLAESGPDSAWRAEQWGTLRAATASGESVWLDYLSADADGRFTVSRREVSVVSVVPPRFGGWCFLRNADRKFRIDRVRGVVPSGRRPARPGA